MTLRIWLARLWWRMWGAARGDRRGRVRVWRCVRCGRLATTKRRLNELMADCETPYCALTHWPEYDRAVAEVSAND